MSHEKIVTAFREEQQAQVAKEKLIAEGIAEKNIDIIAGNRLQVEDKEIRHPSFWQRIFGDDVDDNYASEYNRALQTGGVLLTVRASKEEAGNIEMLLNEYSSDYSTYVPGSADRDFMGETDDRFGSQEPLLNEAAPLMPEAAPDETLPVRDELVGMEAERIPAGTDREALKLAEEQIEIGKRQVSDGVVRLRRYTVEDQVAEDISLYDQHAEVFRNAVDQPAYLNDVDWSEKTIEVEESHEVPTVNKTAHIKEEVGVRAEGNERVETVKDSVRRQEVKVEKDGMLTREDDLAHHDH